MQKDHKKQERKGQVPRGQASKGQAQKGQIQENQIQKEVTQKETIAEEQIQQEQMQEDVSYDEVLYDENIYDENMYERDFIDEDLEEDDLDGDDFGENNLDEEQEPTNPLMTAAVFLGLVVLAAIICAVLWTFMHRNKGDDTESGNNTSTDIVETETLQQETDSTEDGNLNNGEEDEEGADGAGNQSANPNGNPEDNSNEDDGLNGAANGEVNSINTQNPSTEGNVTDSDSSGSAGNTSSEGTNTVIQEQEPISGNESMLFTETSDTGTAKDVTNLRSVPSTQDADNVVAQLGNGENISRTGVNDTTGWSRLDYNGQTVYAVTRFLTTDLNYKTPVTPSNPNRVNTQDGRVIIFTDCSDYVTPKEYVNLRVEPSTSQGDSTVKCQVSNGTNVHRTGYSSDSGWSRVEYNGDVLYVVSSMVSTVNVEEQTAE